MNDLLDIWNADAFRLRWQMAYQAIGNWSEKAHYNSALFRLVGSERIHVFFDLHEMLIYAHSSNAHRIFRGTKADAETVLGVYLWWLTKRGIISA